MLGAGIGATPILTDRDDVPALAYLAYPVGVGVGTAMGATAAGREVPVTRGIAVSVFFAGIGGALFVAIDAVSELDSPCDGPRPPGSRRSNWSLSPG